MFCTTFFEHEAGDSFPQAVAYSEEQATPIRGPKTE
jgi:hypothetical protein